MLEKIQAAQNKSFLASVADSRALTQKTETIQSLMTNYPDNPFRYFMLNNNIKVESQISKMIYNLKINNAYIDKIRKQMTGMYKHIRNIQRNSKSIQLEYEMTKKLRQREVGALGQLLYKVFYHLKRTFQSETLMAQFRSLSGQSSRLRELLKAPGKKIAIFLLGAYTFKKAFDEAAEAPKQKRWAKFADQFFLNSRQLLWI